MFHRKIRNITILAGTVVLSLLLVLHYFPVQVQSSNNYALVAGEHGSIFAFDGKSLVNIPSPTIEDLNDVKWRHDSTYALLVGSGGTVLKYDGSSATTIPNSAGPDVTFKAVSWSPDDSQALIVGTDRSAGRADAIVFRFDGQSISWVSTQKYGGFNSVAWGPDGSYALIAGFSTDGVVHGTLTKFDGNVLTLVDSNIPRDDLNGVTWAPNGKYALVGGGIHGTTLNTTLFIYDGTKLDPTDTSKCCFKNDAHTTNTISFSQDSSVGMVNGNKGLVIVFDNQSNPTRIRNFVNFQNKLEDLHHIGDFYSSSFVPGTHVAYVVGGNSTVARFSDMSVVLLDQNTGGPAFRGISIATRNPRLVGPTSMAALHIDPQKSSLQLAMNALGSVEQPALLLVLLSVIPVMLILGSRTRDSHVQDIGFKLDPVVETVKTITSTGKTRGGVSLGNYILVVTAGWRIKGRRVLGLTHSKVSRLSNAVRSSIANPVHDLRGNASLNRPLLVETHTKSSLYPNPQRSTVPGGIRRMHSPPSSPGQNSDKVGSRSSPSNTGRPRRKSISKSSPLLKSSVQSPSFRSDSRILPLREQWTSVSADLWSQNRGIETMPELLVHHNPRNKVEMATGPTKSDASSLAHTDQGDYKDPMSDPSVTLDTPHRSRSRRHSN